ncbi:dihydroorotase [bacterium]|nr:dihydroorotase [bacterium]
MKFLLQNGHLIDPLTKLNSVESVYIDSGKVYLGIPQKKDGFKVIDCSGKIIVPGLIDAHCHLRDPGFEYKEDMSSGTQAALAGGFTSLFCMPNTIPVADNADTIEYIVDKSRQTGFVNVYPVGALTISSKGEKLADFDELKSHGAVSFSDDGHWMDNSDLMMRIMDYSAQTGTRIIQHCEDAKIAKNGVINQGEVSVKLKLPGIPSAAEYTAVFKDISLCEIMNGKLHIAHVSTKRSIEIIKQAKERSVDITCEVTPHHLILSHNDIKDDNAVYKVNPPLQSDEDRNALIEALKSGVIDIIATDHAPHADYEKDKGFLQSPFGMIGLETAFSLLYTHFVKQNIISLNDLVYKMSTKPAELFCLKNKGALKDGYDADITVIDCNEEYTIDPEYFFSKSINTPFNGKKVFGKVVYVFVGGNLSYHNGEILTDKASII